VLHRNDEREKSKKEKEKPHISMRGFNMNVIQ